MVVVSVDDFVVVGVIVAVVVSVEDFVGVIVAVESVLLSGAYSNSTDRCNVFMCESDFILGSVNVIFRKIDH